MSDIFEKFAEALFGTHDSGDVGKNVDIRSVFLDL